MLSLFRKTRWRFEGPQKDFFDTLFAQLPTEYAFLKDGSDRGLYRGFMVNHSLPESYTVLCSLDPKDPAIRRGVSFRLTGLIVQEGTERLPLNLSIHDGLWIGFRIALRPEKFVGRVVDMSGLEREGTDGPKVPLSLSKLLDGLQCEGLDLVSLGEVDLNDKCYYSICDLDNGDLLAIDVKGQVFRLTHDPFKVAMIHKSIREFVADVNAGRAQVR